MNYQTLSLALASAKGFFNKFLKKKNDEQLLDPMSTLIKLSLIGFCEKGTKISIYDNSIELQKPSLLQGAIRWTQGDNRTDLHNLYAPIEKALTWYNPKDNKELTCIYELAKDGLKLLKNTYTELGNSNLVSHTISYYITIIDNKLNGIKNTINTEKDLAESIYKEDSKINKLQIIWTNDEIKIVYHCLLQLKEAKNKNKGLQSYINSIISILEGKDYQVRQYLYHRMTSI